MAARSNLAAFVARTLENASTKRRPSARWAWSYEVPDTKFALSVKPYLLLQLCTYNEHVERLQKTTPAHAGMYLGSGVEHRFCVDDYLEVRT